MQLLQPKTTQEYAANRTKSDDRALVRQGIRALLADAVGIVVVGEAKNGRATVDQTIQPQPDVVLMDINMSAPDGLETMRLSQQTNPVTRILILSMHDNIEMVHEALQNGAKECILKASLYDELESAIRAVAAGQLYQSDIVTRYLEEYDDRQDEIPTNPLDQLSDREREVLELLAHGYTSKAIAREMSLSKKTVDKHRASIMKKLNANTPIELGRMYARYSQTS